MIPIWLAKIAAKKLIKTIEYRVNLKKIDKYVNKPNELDKQMKQLQKTVSKYGKYIEQQDKKLAILQKDSHPISDWVCLECGCNAKKVEKPTRKRRKRKIKKEK